MVVLFGLLLATPIVLMIASQTYAMHVQDSRGHYVVLLVGQANPHDVAREHRKRFKAKVHDVWDSSTYGYSASIPVRKVKALESDSRVLSVHAREER